MPYDEKLADRIRKLLPDGLEVTERKMFGGLAFLVNGNMSITVSGQGGILVRVNTTDYEKYSNAAGVELAVMRGKKMTGWLRVSTEHLNTKKQLEKWLKLSLSFAESLPPKR